MGQKWMDAWGLGEMVGLMWMKNYARERAHFSSFLLLPSILSSSTTTTK
jgi:hypothetical protein